MRKPKRFENGSEESGKLVVSFGQARLIRAREGGQMTLRGGSSEERGTAREWISLFLHEAIYREE